MISFEVHDAPAEADAAVIDAGLGDFNDTAAPLHLVQGLATFARDGDVVIGGAVGRTWGTACELQQLWVRPEHRRRGVAHELVARFEARARERGCTSFYLYTFSFQARGFYESQGYHVAHALHGYPLGIAQYLMVKPAPLAPGSPATA